MYDKSGIKLSACKNAEEEDKVQFISLTNVSISVSEGLPIPHVRLSIDEQVTVSMVEKPWNSLLACYTTCFNHHNFLCQYGVLEGKSGPLTLHLYGTVTTILSTVPAKNVMALTIQGTDGQLMKIVSCGDWTETGCFAVGHGLN